MERDDFEMNFEMNFEIKNEVMVGESGLSSGSTPIVYVFWPGRRSRAAKFHPRGVRLERQMNLRVSLYRSRACVVYGNVQQGRR